MTRWPIAIALCGLLFACTEFEPPFGSKPDPASEADSDPTQAAYVLPEDDPALEPVETAEDPEEEAPDPVPTEDAENADEPEDVTVAEEPVADDPNAAARATCIKGGGGFTKTESGAFVCVKRTRDSGKACTASSQCKGACLARSRTCSPVIPLIGCHEIFTNNGSRATVCTD